jgi:hypothetical protein
MAIGHWHIETCADCGEGVLTRQNGGHEALCKKCKRERKLRYMRDYNDKRVRKRGESIYTIIKDPDPIAGFSKGAQLTKEEHLCMLNMNSYTPGTILRSARGGLWKVIQNKISQELIPLTKVA